MVHCYPHNAAHTPQVKRQQPFGRLKNAATLPHYVYPNDIPSSDRYYADDIVTPSIYQQRRKAPSFRAGI